MKKNPNDHQQRRTRDDCTIGAFERKHELPPGSIRNPNGRDARSDKLIRSLRRDFGV